MAESRGSISPINPCVISGKASDLGTSEESNESSSVGVSSDAAISSAVVTEEMLQIENQLEEEERAKEEKLREKALEEDKERKENCYKRLQHLLSRSSIYAQFLVRQMEKQDAAAKKAKMRNQNKQSLKEEQVASFGTKESRHKQNTGENGTVTSTSRGKKRDLKSPLRSSKRAKVEGVQLSDIFNKEVVTAQANKENKSAENSEKAAFVDTFSRTINGERVSDLQPNLITGGVMRDYQIDALEWLKVLYENGVNGILGDEMGLGKTIECIALIAHLVEMGVSGPYLIACPLSTLCNWVKEFKTFAPEIPVILYHGLPGEREMLRRKIYRKVLVKNKPIYPIVITSYSMVMRDRKYLMNYQWVIIIDEGHRIKNWQCQLVRALKMYKSTNRLLLTGTPLQNNLAELWSLLNFLLPEIFDDLQVFESWFDIEAMTGQESKDEIVAQEQEKEIVSTIHQILTPFLLRRTKADVNLKLPPKKELIVYAPLSERQKELYTAVANNSIRELFSSKEDTEVPEKRNTKRDTSLFFNERLDIEEYVKRLSDKKSETEGSSSSKSSERTSIVKITSNTYMMMMRKVCNHPYLVEFPLDPVTQDYLIDENMVKICGKMQVLDLMLPELKKRGHKVLIFSQFVVMLDVLEFYCEMRAYQYHRLDGKVKIEDRQTSIDDFNSNPSSFLFLISTRAGGLGINLTAADTVIIYDSDWNPQCDLQAQDRCHRYGQTKPVVVYRLVTANTADQKIVERACAKRKLEKMIIRKGQFSSSEHNKATKKITPEELLEILSEIDHNGALNMENVISPENLNALLDRSDMVQSPENESSPKSKTTSTAPANVKGVFEVVEQVDSCDFSRNIDDSSYKL